MKVNIEEAQILTEHILKAKLVPNLLGSPGVGKSDCIRQIAEKYNLKVIDFRLAQSDPTDLNGFPTLNEDRTRSRYAPPENIPLENDTLAINPVTGKKYAGWLLFFDEMNAAPQSVQAASYKIILDREVGSHKLHEKVMMVCAGNLATDRAIVNRLSTAMQSRLSHLEIEVDLIIWSKWARKNNIDSRITSFLNWRTELLHDFKADHSGLTFPCPRTWEFTSKLINGVHEINDEMIPLLQGTIGEGATLEFKGFLDIYQNLPSVSTLENNPDSITIPTDPGTLYALTALVANNYIDKNIKSFMRVINRLPIEYQVITVKDILGGDENIYQNSPELQLWLKNNSDELIE